MTFDERNPSSLDDDQFERMLFDSARQDEAALDIDAFWARLNTTILGVARLSAASAGAANGWALGGRARRALATKWLLAGVIAGSAVTGLTVAAALGLRGRAVPPQPVVLAPRSPGISQTERDEAALRHTAPEEESQPRFNPAPAPTLPKRAAGGSAALSHPSNRSGAARAQAGSTLGAQVALLDAAQTAVAAGMLGEALRLADQYRTDFPDGDLAPEAEVVAIEALAERGDSVALAERASRFLARYPSDPHAARVKSLAR